MPFVETKYFGSLPYSEESVFTFPVGVPAFEQETRFVAIDLPEYEPLIFLQSLAQSELCFLASPSLVLDRDYRLAVSADDLAALEFPADHQPALGNEALVLALVSLHDGFSATANLMAPIVINLRTRRALQAIREDSLYSHQHPLTTSPGEAAC